MTWRPSATLTSLREAARLRSSIRQWMTQQQVLEVQTPALSRAAATDPHVLSMVTRAGRYLQTSPEFPMKRLLAAHASDTAESSHSQPDLYQIATVFRAEESGRYHNSEFTLLEWYRVGMDHLALIDDLGLLLRHVCQTFDRPFIALERRYYGVEVQKRLGAWPDQLDVDDIANYFASHGRSYPAAIENDLDAALNLFVDEFVLPDFPSDAFTVLMDYPVSQSALARVGHDEKGREVAHRFELFFGKVELANGFHELSDSTVQRHRFEQDLQKRHALKIESVPIDESLINALAAGLPDCAGIALGLERLHMVLGDYRHIKEVMSFDDDRA